MLNNCLLPVHLIDKIYRIIQAYRQNLCKPGDKCLQKEGIFCQFLAQNYMFILYIYCTFYNNYLTINNIDKIYKERIVILKYKFKLLL